MKEKYTYAVPWTKRVFLLKLFERWKKSIWQLIWVDLLIYLGLYVTISLLYRFVFIKNKHQKKVFEDIVVYATTLEAKVPLSFLLGFYVSRIISRWWSVCMLLPYMTRSSFTVQSLIPTSKENPQASRRLRLTILRYMNLSIALKLRDISAQIHRRFALKERSIANKFSKDMSRSFKRSSNKKSRTELEVKLKLDILNQDDAVKRTFGKLITEEEMTVFEEIAEEQGKGGSYDPEWWVPMQWATRVIEKARELDMVRSDLYFKELVNMVNQVRGNLGTLGYYKAFNIPLVYTQVVIIGIYSCFLGELFSEQFIDTTLNVEGKNLDTYVPLFAIFKFIFYMGWFKIGYALLTPLGENDAAFPVSDIFTSNLENSVRIGTAPDALYPTFLRTDSTQLNTLDGIADTLREQSPETVEAYEESLEAEEMYDKETEGYYEMMQTSPMRNGNDIA